MEPDIMKKQSSNGMRRGQATIEFILLVVVMLLFINTAIVTNANTVSVAALDVSTLGKARLGAEKLVDSVNYVGFSGEGTKQTITVFIPDKAKIECIPGTAGVGAIKFSTILRGPANGCTDTDGDGKDDTCIKELPVYTDLTLACDTTAGTISGPTIVNYTVTKTTTPSPQVTLSRG
mgnify:CR=1 FL=1